MCEYCANYKKPYKELVLGDIFICSTATYTRVGDGMPFNIPMNYCPNCGKSLSEDTHRNCINCRLNCWEPDGDNTDMECFCNKNGGHKYIYDPLIHSCEDWVG